MATIKHIGGSFAPPIDDETLDRYESIALARANRKVQSHMVDLIKMMRVFHETAESKEAPRRHPVVGQMIPLEEKEIERIWDNVPWDHECDAIGKIFSALPDGWRPVPDATKPEGYRREVTDQTAYDLKNAANHLLWFARELTQDREPCTCDKL